MPPVRNEIPQTTRLQRVSRVLDQVLAAIFWLIAIPLALWALSTAITNILG
jgi:hypothetical protein